MKRQIGFAKLLEVALDVSLHLSVVAVLALGIPFCIEILAHDRFMPGSHGHRYASMQPSIALTGFLPYIPYVVATVSAIVRSRLMVSRLERNRRARWTVLVSAGLAQAVLWWIAAGDKFGTLVVLIGSWGALLACAGLYLGSVAVSRLKYGNATLPVCAECGYIVHGIQSERCPECGTAILRG